MGRRLWASARTVAAAFAVNAGPLDGADRVYHAHIRKSGGTSVNHAFLELVEGDPAGTYCRLATSSDHRLIRRRRTVVGWNRPLIENGRYLYAFSHIPLYGLALPPRTFTITVLRDPAERVMSHYRMIMEMLAARSDHPAMAEEGPWAVDGFARFLDRIPQKHLFNQLWMFSPTFSVGEAAQRISRIDAVIRTRNLSPAIEAVGRQLRLPLRTRHVRRSTVPFVPTDAERDRLREILAPEYELLTLVGKMGHQFAH